MAKTAAERQREWKARQRAGGKKPITVMLSAEAHEILADESNRTGEKYPEILERVVRNLAQESDIPKVKAETPALNYVTSNNKAPESPISKVQTQISNTVTSNEKKPDNLVSKIQEPVSGKEQVLRLILFMKDEHGLSFGEIARRFNTEGIETFSGKGKWHGKTISKMYWKEKKP